MTVYTDFQPEPELDPELAQNGVEFATRVMAKSPATVLGLQPMDAAEFLFIFTIRVLDGKEPLPKSAAADFWVRLKYPKLYHPKGRLAISSDRYLDHICWPQG